jgi:site-specific DNA-methyltransferase (adenine-specific)
MTDPTEARRRLAAVLAEIDPMWDNAPILVLSQHRNATIGDLRVLLESQQAPIRGIPASEYDEAVRSYLADMSAPTTLADAMLLIAELRLALGAKEHELELLCPSYKRAIAAEMRAEQAEAKFAQSLKICAPLSTLPDPRRPRMAERMNRWRTPPEVIKPLINEFAFDLDAAADAETAITPRYLQDSLTMSDWPGRRIWLNPPYGRLLEPFVRRAANEADKGKTVVALIPFRCSAAWWHESVIDRAKEVRCVRKRIKFLRPDNSRPKLTGSCDSCIIVWTGERGPTRLVSFVPESAS